ncbi:MAG: HAD superfamily hydrolase (TIGR01459 family) [Paracoccaceae bacterium]|jgi:HAD superfamily hydrolase (TIGR01459 family)
MTQIIDSFDSIADRYDALYVDLWGCLHNGFEPFAAAVSALEAFRDKGSKILLLTNSPRPRPSVARQLDKIGVARDLYHDICASGDASQFSLAAGDVGNNIYHLGPERDLGFFADLPADVLKDREITRVPLNQAEGIVCTGLFDDDTETPDDYRETFLYAKAKGLKLLCTNPDVMVDKGTQRIFCAGALADAYAEMGGTSLYFGKPHPPIYDLARQRLIALGEFEDHRILCVGDGINTDIRGGIAEDLDTLFITGGLAAKETGTDGQPDPTMLNDFLNAAQLSPTYAIGHLR